MRTLEKGHPMHNPDAELQSLQAELAVLRRALELSLPTYLHQARRECKNDQPSLNAPTGPSPR